MLNRDANVLLTGATGLIAGELVPRLVECGVGRVFCLIRPSSQPSADPHEMTAARLRQRLTRSSMGELLEETSVLEAVPGDVTVANFGMCAADAERVFESVNLIIHCASELSFMRDVSCRETNIAGMRNLIDLARKCRRNPLVVHVSTATICGMVTHRCVLESDGDCFNEEHHNEYTRSKAVAECVLRKSGLPALILRPSIVLSANLPSEQFARAILWFLPLLEEFDAVPVDPASRVDVVPVSFVVDSMVGLLRAPRLEYDCYHISAGNAQAMRCGDVTRYLDGFYERKRPLRLIPPSQWTREMHRKYVATQHQRKIFHTLKYYLPFLNMDVSYDNGRLCEALGTKAIEIPQITEYIGGLLNLITPAIRSRDGSLSLDRISAAT